MRKELPNDASCPGVIHRARMLAFSLHKCQAQVTRARCQLKLCMHMSCMSLLCVPTASRSSSRSQTRPAVGIADPDDIAAQEA